MVDKNTIRAAFSARLHKALDAAGVRARGRGVDVHHQLRARGVDKTTQAVSKWLNGEAMPEADTIVALSTWLEVRREWLEYGIAPERLASAALTSSVVSEVSNILTVSPNLGKVPLISWIQAGAWCEASNFESHDVDNWISCPVAISRSGFALKVRGDSMTNPGIGRSYPDGCIIFVDPEVEANTGDRVVARVPRTNEVTFKVLVEDAGRQFLRPINPQYPIIDITEETHICGKIVGSFLPE